MGVKVVPPDDTIDGPETAGIPPDLALVTEQLPGTSTAPAEAAEVPAGQGPSAAHDDRPPAPVPAEPGGQAEELFAGAFAALREFAASSERYHSRAEHRESVIDHLHSEVDRLRRGERRGLLRPLLVEICRLRNDLLRQAQDLPGDFDAERARLLLRSFAESVEIALENSGVATFAPIEGDPFEPRMHRRVGGEPVSDPALRGRVALVRRAGYLDVDANIPIAPAEVVVFGPVSAAPAEIPVARPAEQPDPVAVHPHGPPDSHSYGSPDGYDGASVSDVRSKP
jgi:molecular chaperone GrpE